MDEPVDGQSVDNSVAEAAVDESLPANESNEVAAKDDDISVVFDSLTSAMPVPKPMVRPRVVIFPRAVAPRPPIQNGFYQQSPIVMGFKPIRGRKYQLLYENQFLVIQVPETADNVYTYKSWGNNCYGCEYCHAAGRSSKILMEKNVPIYERNRHHKSCETPFCSVKTAEFRNNIFQAKPRLQPLSAKTRTIPMYGTHWGLFGENPLKLWIRSEERANVLFVYEKVSPDKELFICKYCQLNGGHSSVHMLIPEGQLVESARHFYTCSKPFNILDPTHDLTSGIKYFNEKRGSLARNPNQNKQRSIELSRDISKQEEFAVHLIAQVVAEDDDNDAKSNAAKAKKGVGTVPVKSSGQGHASSPPPNHTAGGTEKVVVDAVDSLSDAAIAESNDAPEKDVNDGSLDLPMDQSAESPLDTLTIVESAEDELPETPRVHTSTSVDLIGQTQEIASTSVDVVEMDVELTPLDEATVEPAMEMTQEIASMSVEPVETDVELIPSDETNPEPAVEVTPEIASTSVEPVEIDAGPTLLDDVSSPEPSNTVTAEPKSVEVEEDIFAGINLQEHANFEQLRRNIQVPPPQVVERIDFRRVSENALKDTVRRAYPRSSFILKHVIKRKRPSESGLCGVRQYAPVLKAPRMIAERDVSIERDSMKCLTSFAAQTQAQLVKKKKITRIEEITIDDSDEEKPVIQLQFDPVQPEMPKVVLPEAPKIVCQKLTRVVKDERVNVTEYCADRLESVVSKTPFDKIAPRPPGPPILLPKSKLGPPTVPNFDDYGIVIGANGRKTSKREKKANKAIFFSPHANPEPPCLARTGVSMSVQPKKRIAQSTLALKKKKKAALREPEPSKYKTRQDFMIQASDAKTKDRFVVPQHTGLTMANRVEFRYYKVRRKTREIMELVVMEQSDDTKCRVYVCTHKTRFMHHYRFECVNCLELGKKTYAYKFYPSAVVLAPSRHICEPWSLRDAFPAKYAQKVKKRAKQRVAAPTASKAKYRAVSNDEQEDENSRIRNIPDVPEAQPIRVSELQQYFDESDEESTTSSSVAEIDIFEPLSSTTHIPIPNVCPQYLQKVKPRYWSLSKNDRLLYISYQIQNKASGRTFDMLEEHGGEDAGFFAYSCRKCYDPRIMAFFMPEYDTLFAEPVSTHKCVKQPVYLQTKQKLETKKYYDGIAKISKGLDPVPDNMWIIPCSEKKVINGKLYLVSEKNPKKGREYSLVGKRLNDDLVFVCRYCKNNKKMVHALVSYDEDKVSVSVEGHHVKNCSNGINLVEALTNEAAVLTNPAS